MYRTLLCVIVAASGCSSVPGPSADELQAVENPTDEQQEWLDLVVPRAIAWYTAQESALLPVGRPLTEDEVAMAARMGVRHPEKVRIIVRDEFPVPDDLVLAQELSQLGFGARRPDGFTMGYAVLVTPRSEGKRWLLAHELAHVGQCERLGTQALVRRYLLELRVLGYARAPLELEADRLAQGEK